MTKSGAARNENTVASSLPDMTRSISVRSTDSYLQLTGDQRKDMMLEKFMGKLQTPPTP